MERSAYDGAINENNEKNNNNRYNNLKYRKMGSQ